MNEGDQSTSRFTTVGQDPVSRVSSTADAMSIPTRRWASCVDAPMCGVPLKRACSTSG